MVDHICEITTIYTGLTKSSLVMLWEQLILHATNELFAHDSFYQVYSCAVDQYANQPGDVLTHAD